MEADQAAKLTQSVSNTVTDEDMALDRELERLSADEPAIANEGASLNRVTVIRDTSKYPLSTFVDGYQPASTVEKLDQQVWQAKAEGADSVEASDDVFRVLLGPTAKDESMYYKDVRVFRVGARDAVTQRESVHMEAKVFGARK